ncbi:hypothetical protein [Pedobacter faecalis]|uniref:hypothetical protein n=1 Tax=Pedobacter faecalis TaxID=3041495 RepID=UPI00254EE581|nr:hypothetical protein [Pedobacter sp. ELA7]
MKDNNNGLYSINKNPLMMFALLSLRNLTGWLRMMRHQPDYIYQLLCKARSDNQNKKATYKGLFCFGLAQVQS